MDKTLQSDLLTRIDEFALEMGFYWNDESEDFEPIEVDCE